MKTIETLVDDIYEVLKTKEAATGVDLEKAIDDFGKQCSQLMRNLFSKTHAQGDERRTLRMSNIGRDDRYLWFASRGYEKEELMPHTHLKFMYGHMVEELLLFLVKAAGHEVTHEQGKCDVGGIKGHMDCMIDGVVTDVKSASTYGFKKFKDGTLAEDDPFGYVAQIKGYCKAMGTTEGGWLAIEKSNGHLTYLKMDFTDNDIEQRVEHLKDIIAKDTPPPLCDEPVPDGKSGNMKLTAKCSYCPFKKECYPDLRTFLYSGSVRHLTKVVVEPKVLELGGSNAGDF